MTHLLVMVVVVSMGDFWHVTFTPHPENVGVVVVTKCGGKEPVSGYNWVDIDPSDRSAMVRKIIVPRDVPCHYVANVMRRGADDVPNSEYVGEAGTP